MALDERRELVQNDTIRQSSRRRTSAQNRPQKGKKASPVGDSSAVSSPPNDKPPDLEALRTARLDYINTPAEERRKKMKYVGETIIREAARSTDIEHVRKVSASKRRRKASDPVRKHRQRKARDNEGDTPEYQSVYQKSHRKQDVQPMRADVEKGETDDSDCSDAKRRKVREPTRRAAERPSKTGHSQQPSEQASVTEKERHISGRRQSEPTKRIQHVRRNSYGIDERQSASIHRYVNPDISKYYAQKY
jgi:hypothetical protein